MEDDAFRLLKIVCSTILCAAALYNSTGSISAIFETLLTAIPIIIVSFQYSMTCWTLTSPQSYTAECIDTISSLPTIFCEAVRDTTTVIQDLEKLAQNFGNERYTRFGFMGVRAVAVCGFMSTILWVVHMTDRFFRFLRTFCAVMWRLTKGLWTLTMCFVGWVWA